MLSEIGDSQSVAPVMPHTSSVGVIYSSVLPGIEHNYQSQPVDSQSLRHSSYHNPTANQPRTVRVSEGFQSSSKKVRGAWGQKSNLKKKVVPKPPKKTEIVEKKKSGDYVEFICDVPVFEKTVKIEVFKNTLFADILREIVINKVAELDVRDLGHFDIILDGKKCELFQKISDLEFDPQTRFLLSPKIEKIENLEEGEEGEDSDWAPPKLTKEGYSTIPGIEELQQMNSEQLSSVRFSILNKNVEIRFLERVDLRNVDLDDVFELGHANAKVYAGEAKKPLRGTGLNKSALITYFDFGVPYAKEVDKKEAENPKKPKEEVTEEPKDQRDPDVETDKDKTGEEVEGEADEKKPSEKNEATENENKGEQKADEDEVVQNDEKADKGIIERSFEKLELKVYKKLNSVGAVLVKLDGPSNSLTFRVNHF